MSTCLNCEKSLSQAVVYCPYCGQKKATHRLNFHSVGHEVFHYFTHLDRNIFSLIAALSTNPGRVLREYLHGKRKKYFPPVTFFLLVAGLLVLSVTVFNTFEAAFQTGSLKHETPATRPLFHLLNSKINWILLFTTPLIALLYRILFFKKATNFIEHLVISLYCMGFMLLVFAVVMAPAFYFINTTAAFERLLWIFTALTCLYYTIAYYQLHDRKGAVAFLKTVSVTIVVFLTLILLIVFSIRLYYLLTKSA